MSEHGGSDNLTVFIHLLIITFYKIHMSVISLDLKVASIPVSPCNSPLSDRQAESQLTATKPRAAIIKPLVQAEATTYVTSTVYLLLLVWNNSFSNEGKVPQIHREVSEVQFFSYTLRELSHLTSDGYSKFKMNSVQSQTKPDLKWSEWNVVKSRSTTTQRLHFFKL